MSPFFPTRRSSDLWPFGPVLFDQKDSCPHCQSLVFEIQSCPDCGEPFLPADDLGDRVLPRRSDQDTDEFRENSYRDRDHEDDEEEERQPEGIAHPRLIAINAQSQSTPVGFDVVSGELTDGAGQFSRSEEHASELQSLMRSSYAVFCLTKKSDQKE